MRPIVIRTRVPVTQADARDVSPKQRDGDLNPTSPVLSRPFSPYGRQRRGFTDVSHRFPGFRIRSGQDVNAGLTD
jgi:hypothetical protein